MRQGLLCSEVSKFVVEHGHIQWYLNTVKMNYFSFLEQTNLVMMSKEIHDPLVGAPVLELGHTMILL